MNARITLWATGALLAGASVRMVVALAADFVGSRTVLATSDPRDMRASVDAMRSARGTSPALEMLAGVPVAAGAGRDDGQRELFDRHGALARFAALHGPHPVRPLGLSRSALREQLAPTDPLPCEPFEIASRRLGALNLRTPNPLRNGRFQSIAFFVDGQAGELAIGDETGGLQIGFDNMASAVAAPAGGIGSLSATCKARLETVLEEWFCDVERARRAAFVRTMADVRGGRAVRVRDCAAVFAQLDGGALSLVTLRRGDDARVDEAIARFVAADADCRRAIEELFR